MQGTAFVFINRQQAVGFGHVGWGFSLDAEQRHFYFGSTDHLYRHKWWDLSGWIGYAHVPARANASPCAEQEGQRNLDWWGTTGSYDQMLQIMRDGHHIRYHALCALPVLNARPEKAIACAQSLAATGWSLLLNNCVHHAYQVLSNYGADLPAPNFLLPKVWYASLPGCRQPLS